MNTHAEGEVLGDSPPDGEQHLSPESTDAWGLTSGVESGTAPAPGPQSTLTVDPTPDAGEVVPEIEIIDQEPEQLEANEPIDDDVSEEVSSAELLEDRPTIYSPDLGSLPSSSEFTGVVRPLPRIIAIANQKGGVGKTTTAVNTGAALAELGYRVLLVDLDPQGNASTGLGINTRGLDASVYDVLLDETPLDDIIEPTATRNLFVAPASLELAGAEIELVPVMSRESRLKRALEEVDGSYDFILIDCPPSLGLLTINAFTAAREVMVPIQCEYYALEGLGQLIRNVALVQRNLNPALEISVMVLVMYDGRTKLAEHVASEVRSHFGDKVCRNVIPRTIRLSEAPSFGQPITSFDSGSRGAVAYRELAREVSGGAA